MTDFEKNIYNAIASSNGIKGAEIAKLLHVEKKQVNSTLSRSSALKAVVKQGSDYKWYLIADNKPKNRGKIAPKPDEDLQKLCNYYLQCISLESSSSVSQFLSSKYDYKYAILNDLKIDSGKDTEAISLLNRIASNREKKAYLGYPIRIFTVFGKGGVPYKKIAPVFLFPIEYVGGNAEVSWIPTINMEVIRGYCGGSEDSLVNELVSLETELGMNNPDSDVDVDELILRLRDIRDWEWKESINPYEIPKSEDITNFPDGIFNRPIVIEATKGIYTAGLESELMVLSMMPEENYRGTALYAWIKECIQKTPKTLPKQILEVLPLNTEQAMAVETSLTSNLTIVTGPPGTGKSQVVTDLLANIAWNGKSALFSSRNNKAVDVVDKRVNELSRRPCLLRIGSNNNHASRLAEIIEGFLNSSATEQDESELQYLKKQYDKLINKETILKQQKLQFVQSRNELDEAEQDYCRVRRIVGSHLYQIDGNDSGKIMKCAQSYSRAVERSKKENNNFFARLFWFRVEPKRIAEVIAAERLYKPYALRYNLIQTNPSHSDSNVQAVLSSAEKIEKVLSIALKYRKALGNMRNAITLETLDQELLSVNRSRASIAQKLWDKWLRANRTTFSSEERKSMINYITTMKLTNSADLQDNPELKKQYSKMIKLMTRYLQCWAVTSLSAKSRIPFEAGLFDYVIIDEASQCDIASIIPLLFRAKRAVIIGDPKQLQHISKITAKQDLSLLKKYNIDSMWSYSANSLYALASAKAQPESIIQLRDHFRSCAEIIEYSNETFYDGSLRTATKYDKLKAPPGEKPGIRWIDVAGKTIRPSSGSAYNPEEVAHIVSELKRLVDVGYNGTIGVTTPFHLQAEKIRQALEKEPALFTELIRKHDFLADTVHKFQGDERDLMIFFSVVTNSASNETTSFLNSTDNLFNVAITRTRSMLVVIGDYSYCGGCNISYLQRFAKYYKRLTQGEHQNIQNNVSNFTRNYPEPLNTFNISDWEKVLYTALFDAGIRTVPQYPTDRYRLDMALVLPNGRKLDIEVDGEMYHRSWNKELCYRDQIRNQRLFELGWDIKRFWVYQIRDDLPWCIKQIQNWRQDVK